MVNSNHVRNRNCKVSEPRLAFVYFFFQNRRVVWGEFVGVLRTSRLVSRNLSFVLGKLIAEIWTSFGSLLFCNVQNGSMTRRVQPRRARQIGSKFIPFINRPKVCKPLEIQTAFGKVREYVVVY